jgi:YidC/Oxa1 family membrane protein insertase
MDNVRLFLLLALAFTGMLLWQAWQEDYGQAARVAAPTATESTNTQAVSDDTPSAPAPSAAAVPAVSTDTAAGDAAGARLIEVLTDTLRLKIDTRGGTIVEAYLQQYPVSLDQPDNKFRLLSSQPAAFYVAQSGLLSRDAETAPTHQALYQAAADQFVLQDGEDSLTVDLVWRGPKGITVLKRYEFTRGTHEVTLTHTVNNQGEAPWTGGEYRQLQRTQNETSPPENAFMYTYTGGAIYSPEDKYKKFSFEDLGEGKLNRAVTGGWVAMLQHYFLAAIIPDPTEPMQFEGQQVGNTDRYLIRAKTEAVAVAPGTAHSFTGALWLGPKLQDELSQLAPGLDLTVDYGWLAFLAQPMWWVLEWIHDFVGNWGWAIIIFTILIKLAFFKLSETSYRSMANMRKLAPRMQALKDRYGDDKQRMQQAMMEMYKKEKINPLGGCLPMLVQIPFFIALYWVLLESVELRQAPWILWIKDLSIKDPYFVLPVLMGITMFVQQKLNPAPPDPLQAKILMALPVVFTVMFAFFPSGLVLYWFVNNLLSIAQQWVITRRIEQGAKA